LPLIIPFAAKFGLGPFHMAMMFLLNLEIAYLSPPLGLNLFVTSFRFNKPMLQLYRISLPFVGILVIGLILVMTIPWLSTVMVLGDIAEAKARSAEHCEPPREAWLMECVQEDRNNPLPCKAEEKQKWCLPSVAQCETVKESCKEEPEAAVEDEADKRLGAMPSEEDMLKELLEGGDKPAGEKMKPMPSEEEMLNELLKE
jgi:hypothetical protein